MTNVQNIYEHPEYFNMDYVFEGDFLVDGVLTHFAEEWRQIPGIKYGYECSSFGRIKSPNQFRISNRCGSGYHMKGMMLRPSTKGSGHYQVGMPRNWNKCKSIHYIVACTWICDTPFIDANVNHKDGILYNNHYTNFEWCTRAYNTSHAWKTGLKSAEQHSPKPIIMTNMETGEKSYFASVAFAVSAGYNKGHVWDCIRGDRNKHKNSTWRLATPEEIEEYKKSLSLNS